MTKLKIFAAAIALSAALGISAGSARAQAAAAAAAAAPIVVHTIRSIVPKSKTSGDWMKAEVIHFDASRIIVSEDDNPRMIHTFTFATTLQPKMQTLMDKGGYQYGDRVKILYQPGQTVAVKIHGKPSKPQ